MKQIDLTKLSVFFFSFQRPFYHVSREENSPTLSVMINFSTKFWSIYGQSVLLRSNVLLDTVLLLLLGEADGGGGAGLGGGGGGGLGGFFGGRGGYSDRRRSGNRNPAAGVAARGKREALRELRTLLDHTAPFSELGRPGASLSPMDQLNKQSFWDSSLRLINDRAWTELAPLLRKMQLAKTFTSANPALDGKVTWSATGGGADCGKPVAPVAPPVFGWCVHGLFFAVAWIYPTKPEPLRHLFWAWIMHFVIYLLCFFIAAINLKTVVHSCHFLCDWRWE